MKMRKMKPIWSYEVHSFSQACLAILTHEVIQVCVYFTRTDETDSQFGFSK